VQLKNFDILNAAVALLSFLIFFIHWMTNKKPSLPNFLFRFFLLANSYYYIVAAFIQSGGILNVPHLFRTGSIAGLVATPLVYIILIKSLKNERWKNSDYLHFIPALLYIIDFIPFFILPAESKIQAIKYLARSGNAATLGFNEGWIFNGTFWVLSKVLQTLAYSVVCFLTLVRIVGKSGDSFKKENSKLIFLLYWLSAYLFLNTIPVALSFANLTGSGGWQITSIIIFSSTLLTCLFLLFNPEVLYGLKGIWIITEEDYAAAAKEGPVSQSEHIGNIKEHDSALEKITNEEEPGISPNNIRKTYLSERQVENMDEALSKYMNETQAYLEQRFSLPQLAKGTGFQLQHVSAFLNQHLGESFNDFTNKFRVNHLISLFEQDKHIIDQFTLESLGKLAGFGSRSTFINAFKKVTGQTPSAYFRP